jgi:hypothetical protein
MKKIKLPAWAIGLIYFLLVKLLEAGHEWAQEQYSKNKDGVPVPSDQ